MSDVARTIASQEPTTWEGHETSGLKLMRDGHYVEAQAAFRAALEAARAPGASESQLPLTLNSLGSLYLKMYRNADARRSLMRSFAAWQHVAEPDNLEVGSTYNNLAVVYMRERSYAKAQVFLNRSLYLFERQLGPEHPEVARVLSNLGRIQYGRHKLVEAERLHGRALAIWEKVPEPDELQTAMGYYNLAMIYAAQRRRGEAGAQLERAISIFERSAPEHPNLGLALYKLGGISMNTGDYERAEGLFQRARTILEHGLGSESPAVGQLLTDYAALLLKLNRKREADELRRHAKAILQQPDPGRYIVDATDYGSPPSDRGNSSAGRTRQRR
jgi:tetratricopeptide (TPR) repeat protein